MRVSNNLNLIFIGILINLVLDLISYQLYKMPTRLIKNNIINMGFISMRYC